MIVKYEQGAVLCYTPCPNGYTVMFNKNAHTIFVNSGACEECTHHRSHTADTVDCAFGEEK